MAINEGGPNSQGTGDFPNNFTRIRNLPNTPALLDLNNIAWRTTRGQFHVEVTGDQLSNVPTELDDSTQYRLIINAIGSIDSIDQTLTIDSDDWEGARRFVRSGSPPSQIIGGPWVELISQLSEEGAVITLNNTITPIMSFTPAADSAYLLRYEIFAKRTDSLGYAAYNGSLLVYEDSAAAEIVSGIEEQLSRSTEGGMGISAVATGADIEFRVTGRNSQTWQWRGIFGRDRIRND